MQRNTIRSPNMVATDANCVTKGLRQRSEEIVTTATHLLTQRVRNVVAVVEITHSSKR